MTWLALAPWQAWTLAAATAAAVAWLFFLKLRHPRRAVPSLLLWRRALEKERPQSAVERLRRLVSLVVAVAIALLLALAPGRPVGGDASPRAVITIVIDTSPSMASRTADGQTRFEHAKARARGIVAAAGPAARVRIADTAGRAAESAEENATDAVRRLDEVTIWPGPDRLPRIDDEGRDAIVITDGVRRRSWPAHATRVSVFEPAVNVGITAFDVRPVPSRPLAYEAYIEITNASPDRRRAELSIRDAKGVRVRRSIEVPAGESYRDALDVTGLARGEIRAAISTPDDAFAPDDEAVAYVAWDRPIRTLLVTDGHPSLEMALGLDPALDVTTVRPSAYAGDEGADVCVFDRFAPEREPVKPALLLRPPAAPWLSAIARTDGEVARPVVRTWDATQPVLRFVKGADIRIDRSARLGPARDATGVRVIADAADTALVLTADRPVRRVLVGFDLRDTDFPIQLGFPLFLRNAIVWLAGIREPLRAIPGTIGAPWPDAEIVTAAGATVPMRRVLDATIFDAAGPTVVFARRPGETVPIVIDAADSARSNVNASEFDGPAPDDSVAPRGGGELWPRMLMLAFVLVAVEWITFHRRVTV